MEDEKLYLIYVNPIGTNMYGMYEYEFFFSKTPNNVWNEQWLVECPSACDDMMPNNEYVDKIERLTTIIPFFCIQENSCFSFKHCIDQIIAIAFENISEYTEYPEPFRIVFHFGDEFEDVEDKLAQRHQFFKMSTPPKIENTPEE